LNKLRQTMLKGILPAVILNMIEKQPMHGYQIITSIRRQYHVYYGPSTIYPLLNKLEKEGYIKGEWDLTTERPRKIYTLTSQGKKYLDEAKTELRLITSSIIILEQQEIIKEWILQQTA